MRLITLALALSAAAALAPSTPSPPASTSRNAASADPCRAARAIAEMPPCLDRASCLAVGAWEELVSPLEPRLAPGAPASRVAIRPTVCPAVPR